MAKKHIYVTDLEGTGTHYFGTIEWAPDGSFTIEVEVGHIHCAVGYYTSVSVLDITFEELEVLQSRAILDDLESRVAKEAPALALVGVDDEEG
ncbi:MAG: hypothetical protein JKY81_02490 [Colwellia sp.]|nr:hypothetical protein [Colwellia sp.]